MLFPSVATEEGTRGGKCHFASAYRKRRDDFDFKPDMLSLLHFQHSTQVWRLVCRFRITNRRSFCFDFTLKA